MALNVLIYQIAGFIALFALLYGLYSVVFVASKILQKIVDISIFLTLPSKLAGAIIGLVEGYLVTFLILLALVIPLRNYKHFNEGNLSKKILYESPIVSEKTNGLITSIDEVKTLVLQIKDKEITKNDANLQLIGTMIKYKVVDAHTVEQLVILDKLSSIKGIDVYYENKER